MKVRGATRAEGKSKRRTLTIVIDPVVLKKARHRSVDLEIGLSDYIERLILLDVSFDIQRCPSFNSRN